MAKCSKEFDTHKRDPKHVQKFYARKHLHSKGIRGGIEIKANWLGMTTAKDNYK